MMSVSHPAVWLAGYIPDIPTPFNEHGAVDLAAFAKLCERQIDAGVTAILVSLFNLITDIAYSLVDPRVELGR